MSIRGSTGRHSNLHWCSHVAFSFLQIFREVTDPNLRVCDAEIASKTSFVAALNWKWLLRRTQIWCGLPRFTIHIKWVKDPLALVLHPILHLLTLFRSDCAAGKATTRPSAAHQWSSSRGGRVASTGGSCWAAPSPSWWSSAPTPSTTEGMPRHRSPMWPHPSRVERAHARV